MSEVASGQPITLQGEALQVPSHPIIPFIEGDGIGPDIWRASQAVFDAAVEKAYGGERQIVWREVLAGQKAFDATGNWLPDETLDAFRELHDPHRRRYPLVECRAAADSRPLRLFAPRAVFPRCAFAGQAARANRHGHLSREHRRYLCRH